MPHVEFLNILKYLFFMVFALLTSISHILSRLLDQLIPEWHLLVYSILLGEDIHPILQQDLATALVSNKLQRTKHSHWH